MVRRIKIYVVFSHFYQRFTLLIVIQYGVYIKLVVVCDNIDPGMVYGQKQAYESFRRL